MILNLWKIWRSAPQIIAILTAIMDIIGSAQVQSLLESIRDALKKEVPHPAKPPATEPERKRVVQRLLRRLVAKDIGLSDTEFTNFCNLQQQRNQA